MINTITVPLGSVASINPNLSGDDFEVDEFVDFVPMAAIDADKSIISAQEARPYSEVRKGYTYFGDGDILLAKITPCFENGKISQIRVGTGIGFGSTEFHVIRPHSEKLDARYLVHLLRQDKIRVEGERRMTGSGGQRRVPKSFLEAVPIYLPPLPEQRRVAAILDKADSLRDKRRKVLAHLDSLAQSIFVEMFGDPVTNPLGWPTYSMGGISTFENGDRSSNYPSGDDIKSEGVLFLSTKNIKKNRIDLSTTSFISESKYKSLTRGKARRNDILITLRGTLGSCCIFRCAYEEAFINAQMMIIRAGESILTDYLLAVLSCKQFQEMFERIGQGAAVPQLTSKQLAEIRVAVPPISLQHEFVKRIEAISKMELHLQTAAASADALFESLQNRAFLGKF